jgi:hypothetical protein
VTISSPELGPSFDLDGSPLESAGAGRFGEVESGVPPELVDIRGDFGFCAGQGSKLVGLAESDSVGSKVYKRSKTSATVITTRSLLLFLTP